MDNNISTPLSKLKGLDKLERARYMRSIAYDGDYTWLKKAIRALAMKTPGKQWSDMEKFELEADGREPMEFNQIHSTLELVTGLMLSNPTRVFPKPVEQNDAFLCDILEKLADYLKELYDHELPETSMFDEAVACGRGSCILDIEPDPKMPEDIILKLYNPHISTVKIDPGWIGNNLDDARFVVMETWITIEDFKDRYPDKDAVIDDIFSGGGDRSGGFESEFIDHPSIDDETIFVDDYYDSTTGRVLVCHLEYWENFYRHYAVTPEGESQEIDGEQVKLAKQEGWETYRVRDKKVKWLEFIKDEILFDGDQPIPFDGFSIMTLVGYQDRSVRTPNHFGFGNLLMDPQREINKRWMQSIRLITSQGIGIMAEPDAFVDAEQAEDTINDPDRITWMNEDAIVKQKFYEKAGYQFPAASMQMEQFAQSGIKSISGVNSDLMGVAERQDPGVVVRLRQQQGLTILGRIMDNNRRVKRQIAARMYACICKYMPDSQISKILGTGTYIVQNGVVVNPENGDKADLRAIRDLKYNVTVEDGPGNLTKQMANLAIYMEMMAKGFPVDPDVVINKLDINEAEKSQWKGYIEKGKQEQQQAQAQAAQAQQAQTQVFAQSEQARMQAEAQAVQFKQQLEQQKLMLENKKIETNNQSNMFKTMADNKTKMAGVAQQNKEAELESMAKDRDSKRDLALNVIELALKEKNINIAEQREVLNYMRSILPPDTKGPIVDKPNVY